MTRLGRALAALLIAIPLLGATKGDRVPGQYIVIFEPSTSALHIREVVHNIRATGGEVRWIYQHTVRGFAGRIPAQALEGLKHNPNVEIVEPDSVVTAEGLQAPVPSWGLDRIDRHYLPLNGSYQYNFTGSQVTAYVIDTGIRISHLDFGGRAEWGYDFADNDAVAYDCNGHGTHVAGTIGGTAYGVAKGVRLVAVRVLDCEGSGYMSDVIAGVDWVTAQHDPGEKSVANMSLGGSASYSLDSAIRRSIADGVVHVVAAGNDNADACNYSPSRTQEAITVGATTSTDYRAAFSNKGTCVDLFAPGQGIKSAWYSSDTAYLVISGTSMATPHVAGVAALYLEAHVGTPQQVRDALVTASTKGVIKKKGVGSPNRLLYSLIP